MSAQTHKGIVIPADQVAPCQLVELPNDHHAERAALEALVGGPVERVRYDVDAQLYVHQEGALLLLPVNPRATAHAMRDSEAARRIAEGVGPAARPYDLHGDVVLVGTPATIEDLENQDVPPRFHATFLT
jgi:hypothetical protein